MSPKPRIVVWDLGGVVIKGSHEIAFEALLKLGLTLSQAEQFFAIPEYALSAEGKVTMEEFCDGFRRTTGCTLTNDEIHRVHNDHITGVDEDVVVLLNLLREGGVRLAFATDTNPWQEEAVEALFTMSDYSAEIFRSHEIGMLKKNLRAFPHILRKLGIESSQVLLIDDSPEKIKAAAACGMQTHQFTDAATLAVVLKKLELI